MTEEIKNDLKTDDNQPGAGQPGENEGNTNNGDQTPNKEEELSAEELKQQLEEERAIRVKAESDRDNYKQAVISKQAKEFSLSGEERKPEIAPNPVQPVMTQDDLDDEAKAWKKVEETSKTAAEKLFDERMAARNKEEESRNERIAFKKFFQTHPEIATNEAVKAGIREEYINRNGKSVDGIVLDMEKAMRVWAMENNVELNTSAKPNPANNIPNTPNGRGGEAVKINDDRINQAITNVFPDLAGKPELLKQYREQIESGQRQVPDSVRNLIFNS